MAKSSYLGLRGQALSRAIIALVVAPAFMTYGYNLSAPGGLLTLKNFNEQFPQMNTITAPEEDKSYNSTIQGRWTGPLQFVIATALNSSRW